MELVYLSHPYAANPPFNRDRVLAISRKIIRRGYLPIAPQIYLPLLVDEATDRKLAIELCLGLLKVADAIWVYGSPTDGMRLEIAEAERLGIPVVYVEREE